MLRHKPLTLDLHHSHNIFVLHCYYNCQIVQRPQAKDIFNLNFILFHVVLIENDIYVGPPWYKVGFEDGGIHTE